VRVNGKLFPARVPALQAEDMERVASYLLQDNFHGSLKELVEFDTSYMLEGVGRFRANIFRNKGHLAAVLRSIPFNVPDFKSLNLPPALERIVDEERGLVLVTGETGSGKSSTLAAIVHAINQKHRKHILTIEDPIEFLHEDSLSRITQREIGPDTPSFATGLRAALRQDPDVILVGEMRDTETVEIALKAAETGHLVLSSVHTTDCVRTIGRILGVFDADAQESVRLRLAENLKATVSQRLLPHASGKGRVVAAEIMFSSHATVEFIKDPARTPELKTFIERSRDVLGTQSFDQHLAELLSAGLITKEAALEAATNRSDFERALHFE
jgi:twitching motility protein PilT